MARQDSNSDKRLPDCEGIETFQLAPATVPA